MFQNSLRVRRRALYSTFRFFAILLALFVFANAVPTRAQDAFEPFGLDASSNDAFPFSPKNFGVDLGTSGDESAPKLTATAEIVGVPKDYELDSSVAGFPNVVGFLVVRTSVAQGWHIYSPTQGAGGKPTRFVDVAFQPLDVAVNLTVFSPEPTTSYVVAQDALGERLEEYLGEVDWIAPIAAKTADARPTAETFATCQISGKVDALACSEGEGGTCVPVKVEFEAKYNANRDVVDLLDALKKLKSEQTETSDASATETNASSIRASVDDGTNLDDAPNAASFASRRFAVLLLTAFLGGLILNVTPCVLPVVGLKVLSFFEQAGRKRAEAFLLNVWYAAGVLIVFGVLAFASVGLSFLFTRAIFQIIMSAIVFAMALSLMGVWELQTPAFLGGEKSNELTSKEGTVGAVFKGIVTTLLAIPCGAPLLSPALDWASETTRQGEIGLVVVVYLVIGFGMAFPFLVAGAFPELLKFFPKPGEWMETFRKTMGFFLLIAVVWILYSAPLEYRLPTTAFLFALWFACWNIGRNQYEIEKTKKKIVGWIVSLVVLSIVGLFSFNLPGVGLKTTLQSADAAKLTRWAIRAERAGELAQDHWALFDRATLDRELAKGRVVAVDFTADWCMNCKFLEKTILHTPEIEAEFDSRNILTLTADWTNQDAQTPDVLAINELLDAAGARQVPKLMIFTPEKPEKPIVLSGIYTKGALLDALRSLDAK